ncbi:MAG: hypothetical protein H0U84_10135 [Thermoleophilaceae bacterium]|nr:hypothetical protein [Thermoleophilaceae bacterium]
MKLLDRLRKGPTRSVAEEDAHAPEPPGGDAALPIAGYDRLSEKEVIGQLHLLSQVELGVIEAHERSHGNRPAVLNKLGYVRVREPLPGYDDLDADQVVAILGDADSETVRAVRDYERKFQGRREISTAVGRILPTAKPSEREDRVREEKVARMDEGFRSRAVADEALFNAKDGPGSDSPKP